jgi:hypothetical protein
MHAVCTGKYGRRASHRRATRPNRRTAEERPVWPRSRRAETSVRFPREDVFDPHAEARCRNTSATEPGGRRCRRRTRTADALDGPLVGPLVGPLDGPLVGPLVGPLESDVHDGGLRTQDGHQAQAAPVAARFGDDPTKGAARRVNGHEESNALRSGCQCRALTRGRRCLRPCPRSHLLLRRRP